MNGYPYRAGVALDELLNTLLLNGAPEATISEHAAEAQRAERRWGCLLCRWLSWTVERHHCARQLAGTAMTRIAGLKAGAQLLAVAVGLDLLVRWAVPWIR